MEIYKQIFFYVTLYGHIHTRACTHTQTHTYNTHTHALYIGSYIIAIQHL